MDNQVSWMLAVKVKPGELENFRAVMHDMVESTRAEPGALSYEWFIDDDQTAVHIYERYLDSETTVAHLQTFGSSFAERFLAAVEPTGFHVYGEPSEAARKVMAGFGPTYLGTFGGFVR